MESKCNNEDMLYNAYKEDDGKLCVGSWERYNPESFVAADMAEKFTTHGGSDFYATYLFIQKILGKPDGKWSLDVYQAVNMGICGILAWRSALNGNIPIDVPDLSRREQRDKYRNDNACTNPFIAGEQILPRTVFEPKEVPDEVYDNVRRLWENGMDINNVNDEVYCNL